MYIVSRRQELMWFEDNVIFLWTRGLGVLARGCQRPWGDRARTPLLHNVAEKRGIG